MKAKNDTHPTAFSPSQSRAESLLARIRQTVRTRCLEAAGPSDPIDPGRPWLVGFSHGPDSTFLLEALAPICCGPDAPKLVAIHVDHAQRPESTNEAKRAQAHCRRMNITCHSVRLRNSGGESRSRTLRYARFRELALELDASALFLAQHHDDNLETLLFRLMRGSGPLGLASIPAERALGPRTRILRPMLDIQRCEIEAAVRELGLPCVRDPSNLNPAHSPRNRIRHEILPAMRLVDPEDKKLNALLREAQLLARSCAAELLGKPLPHAAARTFSVGLASTETLSPWALEEYWIQILEIMEQRRPGRALLRCLERLHLAGCPSRKRVESRGHWFAERRRGRIELRTGSFARAKRPR